MFDDQVAVITGAGRGLGAAYARLLAEMGASVVVHDAGVSAEGFGADPSVAQHVADEIVAGGSAPSRPPGTSWMRGYARRLSQTPSTITAGSTC